MSVHTWAAWVATVSVLARASANCGLRFRISPVMGPSPPGEIPSTTRSKSTPRRNVRGFAPSGLADLSKSVCRAASSAFTACPSSSCFQNGLLGQHGNLLTLYRGSYVEPANSTWGMTSMVSMRSTTGSTPRSDTQWKNSNRTPRRRST